MTRKFGQILFLSLLMFAFFAGSAFATTANPDKVSGDLESVLKTIKQHPTLPHDSFRTWPKAKMAGADDAGPGEENADFSVDARYLGYDQRGVVSPGPAVGKTVGLTTYDYQHNSRSTRQVAWRGSHDIHIAWMKKNNSNPVIGAGVRITAYQFWNATTGVLAWDAYANFGGDDLHASGERSGYCGVDAMTDGRGLPYNHYDPDGQTPYNYYPVIWPDQTKGAGNWGYKAGVPADCRTEDFAHGNTDWTWPYLTMQLYDNGGASPDTVIHIFASESGSTSNNVMRYFRRYPSGPHPESPGITWDWMTVDTGHTISNIVEAAPPNATAHQGKVALAWGAHFGATYVGDPESGTLEPISLLLEQNAQDVYCMASEDAGETWGPKYNVTKNDTLTSGWWVYGDVGGVIDTAGRFHLVWHARPFVNLTGVAGSVIDPQMDYPLFPLASRIFHWSDEGEAYGAALDDNYITIVRDATGDWSNFDSICTGGAWHGTAVNLPQIGQCDDKLYVTFSQYQDVKNGVWDNCHISAWTQNIATGSANANLYFSVSTMDNGGLNWDPARLMTDFTPRCDTAFTTDPGDPVDPTAVNVCHSHFYNSMSRWGMLVGVGDDFDNAVVVKDAAWTQTGSPNYYLDVFYIDDLWPGGLVQGEGMWAVDPVKWFRLPCVDAEEEPVLVYEPGGIFAYTPSWTKPGEEEEVEVLMSNIGNDLLTMSAITAQEVDNADPAYDGWLVVDERGFAGTITEVIPNNSHAIGVKINAGGLINETAYLEGRVIFDWDGGNSDTLNISYIIADTVQQVEADTVYSNSLGLAVYNGGAYGSGLYDTLGRMDFHIVGSLGRECDTCGNGPGGAEYKYLNDASPFIVRDTTPGVPTEARVFASVAGHGWFSTQRYLPVGVDIYDGFRPQAGCPETDDSHLFASVQNSGLYYTADSTMSLLNTVVAPMSHADTSDFMVLITKVWNNSATTAYNDIYVGTCEDWDIPSDSGVRNGSYFDMDRKLMYMYGYEAGQPDTFCQNDPNYGNDCTDSDLRFGGSAFFSGHQYNGATAGINPADKYEEAQGSFTFKYPNWIGADTRGHLPPDRLYDTLNGPFFGYSAWEATDGGAAGPESLYQNLAMITSYGQFSLGVGDTLTFVKILASEYDGGLEGIQETIDRARAYTLFYLCCDIWGVPGDADTDHKVNILDIVYEINFKYKNGPGVKWPSATYDAGTTYDNCDAIMNVDSHTDGNLAVNILDIVYLINYKYKSGPAPTCPKTFY